MESRIRGELRRWSLKGFGFLRSDDGREFFLHPNNIRNSGDREKLMVGHTMEFKPVQAFRGLQAYDAEIIE